MGEEFNYGYSTSVQPIQLLYTYGMVMPNNPFAKLESPFSNIMKNFTPRQLELCSLVGCLDPFFKMELKDIKMQESIYFMSDQANPINKYLINLMRVYNLKFLG
jgi:hypothetical protein